MGTIPTPPTFSAGQVLTASQCNTLRDCINFWANTPKCLAYKSGGQTLTDSVITAIALDAEVFDVVQSGDSPGHDNTTNNTRIYARTTGKYTISGQITFASNSTGVRYIDCRLNAAGSAVGGTDLRFVYIPTNGTSLATVVLPTFDYPLNAGDYVEIFGFQNSGGSLAVSAGLATTFLEIKLAGT